MGTSPQPIHDVVIGGGGLTGTLLALAFARTLGNEITVALVAPATRTVGDPREQVRATALGRASIQMLEALGVWPAIVRAAAPVRRIDITESALDAGQRPVFLSYDQLGADGQPTMWIVPNDALLAALETATAETPAVRRVPGTITALGDAGSAARRIELDSGETIAGRLIIAADGVRSRLREWAGIRTIGWPYAQCGIVTRVRLDVAHEGVATQHFLPGGPFAVLPLPDNRACITWSEDAETARHLVEGPEVDFVEALNVRLGARIGPATLDGTRAIWPLDMRLARAFIAPRFALVGDSAHAVHPIAGQGFNLAMRDIAALTECVTEGLRAGLDAGDPQALTRYQRWRRFDTTLSTAAFDALNRLFSNDRSLLRSAREAGLGLVDRVPMLKRMLVTEAAGLTGDVPKLLRGALP